MEINRIVALYFSPTGGTKKITQIIASQIAQVLHKDILEIDYTRFENRRQLYSFGRNELLVIGMPVYAGRIPNKILPDLEEGLSGNGAKVIPISVYGNRSFDDALMELTLLLEKKGFCVMAAAAAVSHHVFSSSLAVGRPNVDDEKELSAFASRVAKRLIEHDDIPEITVTGNNPVGPYYTPLQEDGTPARFLKAKPITDIEKCDGCGICIKVCPMNSIDASDCSLVNGICIKCQACVVSCPHSAKTFTDVQFISHVKMLEANYHNPNKNYFFE